MIVLYILLFILSLSILIMVHELGHLATAKMFKVYCFEYSIGFGPKLFSKKRKNGETYFSIRAIPFGGYVSMYGESETVPEGLEIDPSRSLLSIKKWKRAIIMVAGVTMNFLLAILIFFVYEVAFPVHTARYAHVSISSDSIAYNAGVRSGDTVYAELLSYDNNNYVFYDDEAIMSYPDSMDIECYVGFDFASLTLKDTALSNHSHAYKKISVGSLDESSETITPISQIISGEATGNVTTKGFIKMINDKKDGDHYVSEFALTEKDNETKKANAIFTSFTLDESTHQKFLSIPFSAELIIKGEISSVVKEETTYKSILINEYKAYYPDMSKDLFAGTLDSKEPQKINFSLYTQTDTSIYKGVERNLGDINIEINGTGYKLATNPGISMQIDESYNSFGSALGNTFKDFGEASTAIVRGLGALITSTDGWKEVGGIISIGVVSTQILTQNGFGSYLRLWGLISVNLGIVNLLPFPGLDGWQLLVLAVEGIFRKEIPAKVKNIVSLVGIALLFVLMILILIKDVVALF